MSERIEFLFVPRRVWCENGTWEMEKRWRWLIFVNAEDYVFGTLRSERRK